MTVNVAIPGLAELSLRQLLLDVNGTLTKRGELLPSVQEQIELLRDRLAIQLVSADTFGTVEEIADVLGVAAVTARSGAEKLAHLDRLGREGCAAIGNGANDVLVLEAAALGIAVVGPEGAVWAALQAADVVCASVGDALDLLLEPKALAATLRP